MGNSCATLLKSHYTSPAAAEQKKAVVQVVKMDGKILEFAATILVKDLLVRFPGLGVGLSKETPAECLPWSYELKLGNIYFLFPLLKSSPEEIFPGPVVVGRELEPSNHVIKTIKLVITKKQLQELIMSKNVSEIKNAAAANSSDDYISTGKGWKPGLESIPEEGKEFGFEQNKKGISSLF